MSDGICPNQLGFVLGVSIFRQIFYFITFVISLLSFLLRIPERFLLENFIRKFYKYNFEY